MFRQSAWTFDADGFRSFLDAEIVGARGDHGELLRARASDLVADGRAAFRNYFREIGDVQLDDDGSRWDYRTFDPGEEFADDALGVWLEITMAPFLRRTQGLTGTLLRDALRWRWSLGDDSLANEILYGQRLGTLLPEALADVANRMSGRRSGGWFSSVSCERWRQALRSDSAWLHDPDPEFMDAIGLRRQTNPSTLRAWLARDVDIAIEMFEQAMSEGVALRVVVRS